MAAGYGLAEIYVLRKLHKEKMKIVEEEERDNKMDVIDQFKEKKSSGCFVWGFKKIHPNTASPTMDCAGKAADTWDSKS
jgi:hypothetical protein